jgi:micrococcal nuclease
MTIRPVKILFIGVLAVTALLYGWMAGNSPEGKKDDDRAVFVEKISDGDSVEAVIKGKREHIRLIGIDAPEMGQRPWGKKAKKYLEGLVAASGWEVGIEYDVEKRDQYDRILAYLWTRDGRLINEEVIRSGLAVLFTFPPNVKYVDRFRAAQIIARENKIGIWGKGGLKQMPSDYRQEHPRK